MSDNRKCTECWHWWFDGGEPHYSELTPGTDGSVGCLKGHWPNNRRIWGVAFSKFRFFDLDRDMFREYLSLAATCPDFADRALPEPPRTGPGTGGGQ